LAQGFPRADKVILTDDIVERPWSKTSSKGRLAAQVLLGGGGEEIAHRVPNTRSYADRRHSTT
jgi:hypothetical protein